MIFQEAKCSENMDLLGRKIAIRLFQERYASEYDCYSDVNSLQFICNRLKYCCPNFYR